LPDRTATYARAVRCATGFASSRWTDPADERGARHPALGIGGPYSTTYAEPFHVARAFALDP
jgi:hypothetical protein